MRLISKAKPVKIRIQSGGEEHSSLESLRRNFNVSDIQPLLDGRLVRWLRQQGENELANVISEVNTESLNTLEGIMELMKIFFADYIEAHAVNNLTKLTEDWLCSSVYKKNGKYLYWNTLTKDLNNSKYFYNHRTELPLPETSWYDIFLIYKNRGEEDPELFFLLGKMLWEGCYSNEHFVQNKETGKLLIDKAVNAKWTEAISFSLKILSTNTNNTKEDTLNHEPEYNNSINLKHRFKNVNTDKIKNWLKYNWTSSTNEIPPYYPDNATAKEKFIIDYLRHIHHIRNYAERFGYQKALEQAYFYFKNREQGILYYEKEFIIGLLLKWNNNKEEANDAFSKIKDYKLAEYMLSSARIIDDFYFKGSSLFFQISFIKDHLFDYE